MQQTLWESRGRGAENKIVHPTVAGRKLHTTECPAAINEELAQVNARHCTRREYKSGWTTPDNPLSQQPPKSPIQHNSILVAAYIAHEATPRAWARCSLR